MLNKNLQLILFSILFALSDARAEEITFDRLLEESYKTSPVVTRLLSEIAGIKGEARRKGLLDNPELSMETRPYVSDHDSREAEYEIVLQQPLSLSSFGKRQEVEKLLMKQAGLEEKIRLLELGQSLKLGYAKAWTLQERESQLSSSVRRAIKVLESIKKLDETGALPRSLTAFIFAESARLKADLEGIKADRKRALAQLTRLSGKSLESAKLKELMIGGLNYPPAPEDNSLLIQRAVLGSRLSKAQRELARLDAFPKFSPRAGFEHTSDADDRLNVGIQISIPIFNRNQPDRIVTEAEQREQDVLRDYFQGAEFKDELRLIKESFESSILQIKAYREKILPGLGEAVNSAEREFSSGQGNPFQWWQSLESLNSAQDSYLEHFIRAVSIKTELVIYYGEDF